MDYSPSSGLTDSQILERLKFDRPILFSPEASSQGVTLDYILESFKERKLDQVEDVIKRNVEIKTILSLDPESLNLRDKSLGELIVMENIAESSSSSSSSPKLSNLLLKLPTEASSIILSYASQDPRNIAQLNKSYTKVGGKVNNDPLYWKSKCELFLMKELDGLSGKYTWRTLFQQMEGVKGEIDDEDLLLSVIAGDQLSESKKHSVNYPGSFAIKINSWMVKSGLINMSILDVYYILAAKLDGVDFMRLIEELHNININIFDCMPLRDAIQKRSIKSFLHLLSKPELDLSYNEKLNDLLTLAIKSGSSVIVNGIYEDKRFKPNNDKCQYLIESALKGNFLIFEYLWSKDDIENRNFMIIVSVADLLKSGSFTLQKEEERLKIVKLALTNRDVFRAVNFGQIRDEIIMYCSRVGYFLIYEYMIRLFKENDPDWNPNYISVFKHATRFEMNGNRTVPLKTTNPYGEEGRKNIILSSIFSINYDQLLSVYIRIIKIYEVFVSDIIEPFIVDKIMNEFDNPYEEINRINAEIVEIRKDQKRREEEKLSRFQNK